MSEGFQGQAWPIPTGDLADGKEGTPVVGYPVESGGGQSGVAGLEGDEVVLGPTGQLAGEIGFGLDVQAVEAGGEILGFGGQEQDTDGAVIQSSGELAQSGQSGGTECLEGAHGIVLAFATVSSGAAFV